MVLEIAAGVTLGLVGFCFLSAFVAAVIGALNK